MKTKRQAGALWPILAGTSLAARIRRLTFAIFGLAAVAGLALVAFVAQTGYPVLSVAPLPLPGPALTAPGTGVVIGESEDGSLGIELGLPGAAAVEDGPGALSLATAADPQAPALASTGSPQPGLAASTTQPGLAPSSAGQAGLDDEQHSEVTAVTPAQAPTVPPNPAVATAPVQGSNSSSALFVRSSVAPGIGESGDLAKGAPVIPDEPEIPYEPDVPVEPEVPAEPEVPLEPPLEEPPVEEPPAEEPPVEEPAPVTEPPAADPAPEVPAG